LLWLVALFAAYALLGGGVSLVAAIKNRKEDGWWLLLILSLVSLGAGVIAILHPALTALVLVLMMGANAIITGVLEIVIAIRQHKVIQREWLLILAGLVSIAFGVLVFLFPGAGALAMVWLISLYAIVTGILLLGAAWQTRKHSQPEWRGGMGQPAT
jgi:uncharacterized membrane protein HdeD (DUF308 family)